MIVITEHYVLPTIHPILPAQTLGMTFAQKLGELGWVLLDMIFPYLPRPCSPCACSHVCLFPCVRLFVPDLVLDFGLFCEWLLTVDSLRFICWLFMSFLSVF